MLGQFHHVHAAFVSVCASWVCKLKGIKKKRLEPAQKCAQKIKLHDVLWRIISVQGFQIGAS